jgi:DUF1365 family protein
VTGDALYAGTVSHARTHEVRHAFRYPVYMHLFDLDALDGLNDRYRLLGYNRRRVVALHDADHFDGRPLREAVRAVVEDAGRTWPGGRVLLLTHARVCGYVFNPISLYYCFDTDGTLDTVVAEVHNTFGDSHAYVLPGRAASPCHSSDSPSRPSAKKVMHVSPFFTLDGTYHFALPAPGETLDVDIDLTVGDERRLAARLRLRRRPLSDAALARMLLRYPMMTVQVIAAIHWEALRLWWKGVRYLPRPAYAPHAARRTQP